MRQNSAPADEVLDRTARRFGLYDAVTLRAAVDGTLWSAELQARTCELVPMGAVSDDGSCDFQDDRLSLLVSQGDLTHHHPHGIRGSAYV